MRILHLAKYYPPCVGGIEYFLRDLVRAQAARGDSCRVLAHDHRPLRRTSREEDQGVGVLRSPTFGTLVYAPLAPLFGPQLLRLARGFRPDVIHAHLPNTSAFWLAVAARTRAALVLHWHSDVAPSALDRRLGPLYRFYSVFERRLLERADAVIATSQPYLESSPALAPYRSKCRVVPLGLAPQRTATPAPADVAALRARYGDSPLILAVGRFAHYKGFDVLVRAARRLPDATVVLIGQGPEHARVAALAREAGLADRVHLPGALPDDAVQLHLAACDVFCLPSLERTEAFGVVLLEAMAHAKPLVTTLVPGSGMQAVNRPETTGLAVPPGAPEALAAALGALLSDPDRARAMGERARQAYDEHYDIDAVVGGVAEVYKQARATRRTAPAAPGPR